MTKLLAWTFVGMVAACALVVQSGFATEFHYTGLSKGMFGADFNAPVNWTPAGGPPGSGDIGTIEIGDVIVLTANTEDLTTLNIRSGASVFTSDKFLNVTSGAGFTEVIDNANLVVQPHPINPTFATDTLSLRLGGELQMAGGAAIATFVVRVSQTSSITGHGSVGINAASTAGLDLAGTIAPTGGDLGIFCNDGTLDLDGNSGGADLGGMLDVTQVGSLELAGTALADPFSGRMDIGNNNRVELSCAFPMDGQLNFISGTTNQLMAPSITLQSGAKIQVQGSDGKLVGTTAFQSGSDTFLLTANDDLFLASNTSIQAGATFSGAGVLKMTNGAIVTLADNANVGVKLSNTGAGEVRIGASPGNATVAAYEQSASSDLRIELGGLVAGDSFDQLAVTGSASLAGLLDVSLINGFTLTKGMSFKIMDVGGPLTGHFENLVEGAKVGTFDKDLFITYAGGDGNDVVLFTKGFSADFDGDLDVDGADLLIWQRNLGLNAGALNSQGDANGDGKVNQTDLAAWKSQFGSSSSVAAVGVVPEPASALLSMAAAVGLLRRRTPRTATKGSQEAEPGCA